MNHPAPAETPEPRPAPVDLLADLPPSTPDAIAAARAVAGLSQEACAGIVDLSGRAAWSRMERGVAPMEPARWALFLLATGQHPRARVTGRRSPR